jgi:hypothetical protein
VYAGDVMNHHLNKLFKVAPVDVHPIGVAGGRADEGGVQGIQRAGVCSSTRSVGPYGLDVVAIRIRAVLVVQLFERLAEEFPTRVLLPPSLQAKSVMVRKATTKKGTTYLVHRFATLHLVMRPNEINSFTLEQNAGSAH